MSFLKTHDIILFPLSLSSFFSWLESSDNTGAYDKLYVSKNLKF